MNNVFLELPIVKVDPANKWQSKDYAAEHFEKGLFITDDGVLYHLVFYQGDRPPMILIPKEQIEAALVEEARQSGIAEVNSEIACDIDKIKDRVEQIARLVNETKDEVVTRTTVIEDKIDDLGRCGGGGGVNILDVAKSYAVIQKPELIKELK